MTITIVGPEIEPRLDWIALTDALAAGHALPRAEVADTFLYRGKDTLLTRSAWIDGLGLAVKAASVFPGNGPQGMPTINGAVNLFSDGDGTLAALVDFHLVTKWKTAGDSLLSARMLARPDARDILVVAQAQHRAVLDAIRQRQSARAEALMQEHARSAHANLRAALADHRSWQRVPGASLIRRRPTR